MYVVMEITSHRIGDCSRPNRKTLRMRSGRPMSTNTMGAPTSRANTVIASAMRVIGRRHSAPVTRRMAEINVPAWLTPMKKTKLVIYSPHETWLFSPVAPSPTRSWIR